MGRLSQTSHSLMWLSLFTVCLAVAQAVSPSKNYAPGKLACPTNSSLIREGNSLSSSEKTWLEARHEKTSQAISSYLDRVGVDYDSSVLDANQSINVGLAFSGGGFRAMLNAAGQIAALDNRTISADEYGLGGILQSSTYLAGLSGSSWTIGSLVFQEWPTIDEVVFEDPYDVWNLTSGRSLVNYTDTFGLYLDFAIDSYESTISHVNYWDYPSGKGISTDLLAKKAAGFPVSITDAWGRALAHLLFREGSNNWLQSATWSDIRTISAFSNHEMPFPIVTALARRPGTLDYDLNSPIVEFNPFEMGSFDSSVNTFTDIKYLGTSVSNGVPNGTCVQGFDNAAFVVGTSLSLFNQYLNTLVCATCNSLNFVVKFFAKRFLTSMSENKEDIAWYKPNPFYNSEYAKSDNLSSSDTLYLMDGGLAGETIPLSTLMVKERELDLVFAFDNNGPDWPLGTSVINTYERQFTYEGKSTVCPYIPGESTFAYYNLSAKPTFFGCDASNSTDLVKDDVIPPLVIYLANRPYEFWSNTSTMKLTYTDHEKKGMIANAFDIATRMNDTLAEDWQVCVGCAMVRRAEERAGIEQSDQCKSCFESYCWDGSTYENADYVAPKNFTGDGLTNNSMSLWGNNTYIQVTTTASSTSLFSSSFFSGLLSKVWSWILNLF